MSTNPSTAQPPDDDGPRSPSHLSRLLPTEVRGVTFVYDAGPPRPPAFTFSHGEEKGLFVLTWPDGRVEKFRDRPVRQLVVEPDPETGELRPVIKHGLPVFHYLCREEREL